MTPEVWGKGDEFAYLVIQGKVDFRGVRRDFQRFYRQGGSPLPYLHRSAVASGSLILFKSRKGFDIVFQDRINAVGVSPEPYADHSGI
jgi:hypothetical protein